MKKTWKSISLALSALLIVAMMTGCGNTETPKDETTGNQTNISTTADPAAQDADAAIDAADGANEVVDNAGEEAPPVEGTETEAPAEGDSATDAANVSADGTACDLGSGISVTFPGTVTQSDPITMGESTIYAYQSVTEDGISYSASGTSGTEITEATLEESKKAVFSMLSTDAPEAVQVSLTGADGTTYTADEYLVSQEGQHILIRMLVKDDAFVTTIGASVDESKLEAMRTVLDSMTIQ